MADANDTHEWGDVDATARAETYTDYLAEVTDLEAIQTYKRRTHRLLRPAEGDRIVDVGCGRGDDVLMLAEAVGPDGRVVGIDNSERMVDIARERSTDVPAAAFAVDDAMNLTFADDSFDAGRADRVLQHLDDPAAAFAELIRVTRPGCRVCVCEPDLRTIVLDVPSDHSAAFLSWEHSPTRNPMMGGRLYRSAKEAGLADVVIDSWSYTTTDFAVFREGTMLDEWTDDMVDAGAVSRSAVEDWYAALRDADERGVFFYAGTAFVVSGTVPS